MRKYLVGDVAKRLAVANDTARKYADAGLFGDVERTVSGVRLIVAENVERVAVARAQRRRRTAAAQSGRVPRR